MRSEEKSTGERRLEDIGGRALIIVVCRAWRKRMEGMRAYKGKLIGNSMRNESRQILL
jgi:hypothetical protein